MLTLLELKDADLSDRLDEVISDLVTLKPLKKYAGKKPPLVAIERVLHSICYKYGFLFNLHADVKSNEKTTIYSLTILDDTTLQPQGIVYAKTLYELFAKAVLYAFHIVKGG